jgi:hypothetical protein
MARRNNFEFSVCPFGLALSRLADEPVAEIVQCGEPLKGTSRSEKHT